MSRQCKFPLPPPKRFQAAAPAQAPAESGLLARLAREAKENLDSKQSIDVHKLARARSGGTMPLDRILKFLTPFIQHVNILSTTSTGHTVLMRARYSPT